MATDKLFTVVGISKLNGDYKVRFANDIMRIKVLAKHGHEDIRLVELDKATTKLEAVRQLKGMDEFSDVLAQATIADYLERKDVQPKAAPAKTKAVKTPQVKAIKGMTPLGVKAVENEDAPF
jgi:hypothetical protein